jgi:predicted membrane-bound dolichyl-phosphate-mannose-protein mannosyltransferase
MRDLLWAALAFAAAMATKFSAPFLLPVFLLLFAVRCRQRRWLAQETGHGRHTAGKTCS